jgi:hypothetical protein
MNSEPSLKLAPELIWRVVDDNAVVVMPQAGKVRVFNRIGSVIWRLLAEQYNTADIAAYLTAHYNVTPEQAGHDLRHFLAELAARGLLIRETD